MSIRQQAIVASFHAAQRIVIGYDTDIALWDPNRIATLSQAGLHHGADYTPYEGLEITGRPVATMPRRRFVVRDGELVGDKGQGRYVTRGGQAPSNCKGGNDSKDGLSEAIPIVIVS
jgi:N-acyl-D-aspartate/D-glutamate deacylase